MIKKVEFDIGQDAYGRSVKAVYHRTYDGRHTWEIHTDAANQRDDDQKITGLSKANLEALSRLRVPVA